MKLVRKISIKSFGFTANELQKGGDLIAIKGEIKSIVSGESTYGTFTGFTGSFEAVNLLHIEDVYVSFKCFLPELAQELVKNNFEKNGVTEFKLKIGTIPNDSTLGYEYVVNSLDEQIESEFVSNIKQLVSKPLELESKNTKKVALRK